MNSIGRPIAFQIRTTSEVPVPVADLFWVAKKMNGKSHQAPTYFAIGSFPPILRERGQWTQLQSSNKILFVVFVNFRDFQTFRCRSTIQTPKLVGNLIQSSVVFLGSHKTVFFSVKNNETNKNYSLRRWFWYRSELLTPSRLRERSVQSWQSGSEMLHPTRKNIPLTFLC